MKPKQLIASFLALSLAVGLCACTKDDEANTVTDSPSQSPVADAEEKAYIEETLNLSNNADLTWTYNEDADLGLQRYSHKFRIFVIKKKGSASLCMTLSSSEQALQASAQAFMRSAAANAP